MVLIEQQTGDVSKTRQNIEFESNPFQIVQVSYLPYAPTSTVVNPECLVNLCNLTDFTHEVTLFGPGFFHLAFASLLSSKTPFNMPRRFQTIPNSEAKQTWCYCLLFNKLYIRSCDDGNAEMWKRTTTATNNPKKNKKCNNYRNYLWYPLIGLAI